jgi:drug/metabolite transporter (DMT)-like permease
MSFKVFAVVLLAALLHAVWNALIKSAGDKLMSTVTVVVAAAMVAALLVPSVIQPLPASWPFIGVSALLTIGYFVLVARIYRLSDLSHSYPVMRGTAPLLVAVASAVTGTEPMSAMAWLGVLAISVGIVGVADSRAAELPAQRQGLSLALGNAVVIAGYTLVDGFGVRRSGAPMGYTLWIFMLSGLPLGVWALVARRRVFVSHLVRHWHLGLMGGIGSITSYGLVLWAMTAAPIPLIAALRETSIVFGTILAWLWLRERVGLRRIVAVCIIASGAAALRAA